MSDFPKEAEALLSVAPDDFVTERNRLARELRDAGRKDEAAEQHDAGWTSRPDRRGVGRLVQPAGLELPLLDPQVARESGV